MKKFTSVFTLLSLSFLVLSCEKNEEDNTTNPTDTQKTFTIGDYSQVSVDSGKAGEPLYQFSGISVDEEQKIDVDKDGQDDFIIKYKPYHNLSGGQKVSVTLESLNTNIEIASSSYTDSSKICYAQTGNYDSVFYNTQGSYECQGNGNSAYAWIPDYGNGDSHLSPDVFEAGDQVTAQLAWHNSTMLFKAEDKSSDMQMRALYQVEKGQWIRAQNQYLLFRHQVNGSMHYGWMQLSSENLFDFTVSEVAIEKN